MDTNLRNVIMTPATAESPAAVTAQLPFSSAQEISACRNYCPWFDAKFCGGYRLGGDAVSVTYTEGSVLPNVYHDLRYCRADVLGALQTMIAAMQAARENDQAKPA